MAYLDCSTAFSKCMKKDFTSFSHQPKRYSNILPNGRIYYSTAAPGASQDGQSRQEVQLIILQLSPGQQRSLLWNQSVRINTVSKSIKSRRTFLQSGATISLKTLTTVLTPRFLASVILLIECHIASLKKRYSPTVLTMAILRAWKICLFAFLAQSKMRMGNNICLATSLKLTH